VIASAFGRRLFGHLLAGTRETDQETSTVFGVGAGLRQATGGEPVDHTLDGGDIPSPSAARVILPSTVRSR